MITIDQLLESVDLDFEPRWVTKDEDGTVTIFCHKPQTYKDRWATIVVADPMACFECLKLSEFDGKDWTECIYEVPRKPTRKIEKIPTSAPFGCQGDWREKINELVDAVNELKGAKNE
jgi:hypothetical protein